MMDEKMKIVLQHKKNEPDIEIVQIKMNISKTFWVQTAQTYSKNVLISGQTIREKNFYSI